MSTVDELDSLEARIQELERARAATTTTDTATANSGDVSVQAFLHGALAAATSQAVPTSLPPSAGAGPMFASIFACSPSPTPPAGDGGHTAVRAYWWGFHVQLSHKDLATVLDSADVVNDLVVLIGGNIPSPAAPFIKLIGPFVSAAHQLLRSLDRGRGVYISMSWATPGVFIPTTVT